MQTLDVDGGQAALGWRFIAKDKKRKSRMEKDNRSFSATPLVTYSIQVAYNQAAVPY
jgi:hypothetical protein